MIITNDTLWTDIVKSVFPNFDGYTVGNVRFNGIFQRRHLIGIQMAVYTSSLRRRAPMRRVFIKDKEIDTNILIEKFTELNEEGRVERECQAQKYTQEKILSNKAREIEDEYGLPHYTLVYSYGSWQFKLDGLTEEQVRRLAQTLKNK